MQQNDPFMVWLLYAKMILQSSNFMNFGMCYKDII